MADYSTIQQHEPLRVPANWGTNERKMIAQLEEILDDIYRRFGRLTMKDLGRALRTTITDAEGNISSLQQTATSIIATIDGMDGGGVNLLLKSWIEADSANYALADYYFGDDRPQEGETVTITLWGTLGSDREVFRAFNSGGNVPIAYLEPQGDGTYKGTAEWRIRYNNVTATNEFLRIYQIASSGTSSSTITKIKLERGNMGTGWSAAPGEVHNSMVELTNNEFSVSFNGKKAMSVKQDEVRVDVDTLTASGHIAGDVVNTTTEAINITVNEGESLQALIDSLPKYLNHDVYIFISGRHQEELAFDGFVGKGSLLVTFNTDATLDGGMRFSNCQCWISLYGTQGSSYVNIVGRESTPCLTFVNCAYAEVHDMSLRGYSVSRGYGLEASNNSTVIVSDTQIDRCDSAVRTAYCSRVFLDNVIGGSDNDLVLAVKNNMYVMGYSGCVFYMNGTKAKAQLSQYIDNTSSVVGSATESPSTVVNQGDVTEYVFDSFTGYNAIYNTDGTIERQWQEGNVMQGISYRGITGIVCYDRGAYYSSASGDISTALAGKTIRSATVMFMRDAEQGTTDRTARVELCTHGLIAEPYGDFTLTQTGITASDVTNRGYYMFTLTQDIISAIQSGTVRGFGVKSDGNTKDMVFTACRFQATY